MEHISAWRLIAYVACVTVGIGALLLPADHVFRELFGMILLLTSGHWLKPAKAFRREMGRRVSPRELGLGVLVILGLIAVAVAARHLFGWKGDNDPDWVTKPAGIVTLVAMWAALVVLGVWKWRRSTARFVPG